eukprot:scaffold1328_cov394-Prasinococcus_capsulatus_cf.AAC.20
MPNGPSSRISVTGCTDSSHRLNDASATLATWRSFLCARRTCSIRPPAVAPAALRRRDVIPGCRCTSTGPLVPSRRRGRRPPMQRADLLRAATAQRPPCTLQRRRSADVARSSLSRLVHVSVRWAGR